MAPRALFLLSSVDEEEPKESPHPFLTSAVSDCWALHGIGSYCLHQELPPHVWVHLILVHQALSLSLSLTLSLSLSVCLCVWGG